MKKDLTTYRGQTPPLGAVEAKAMGEVIKALDVLQEAVMECFNQVTVADQNDWMEEELESGVIDVLQ